MDTTSSIFGFEYKCLLLQMLCMKQVSPYRHRRYANVCEQRIFRTHEKWITYMLVVYVAIIAFINNNQLAVE